MKSGMTAKEIHNGEIFVAFILDFTFLAGYKILNISRTFYPAPIHIHIFCISAGSYQYVVSLGSWGELQRTVEEIFFILVKRK